MARFEGLDADQRARLRFGSFVGEVDADGLARLRLNEHAVHTWDVAVVLDPNASIGAEAVDFVLDSLSMLARFTGKAHGLSTVVRVTTTDPHRIFTLTLDTPVTLEPGGDAPASAELTLPAEAFIRLIYGRLDPPLTPPLTVSGIELDDLRRVFPGL